MRPRRCVPFNNASSYNIGMDTDKPTRRELLTTEVNRKGIDYYAIAADILSTPALQETLHQLNTLIKDADMKTEQEVADAFAFVHEYKFAALALTGCFAKDPALFNLTAEEQKRVRDEVFSRVPKMTEGLGVFLIEYTHSLDKILQEEYDKRTKQSKHKEKYGRKDTKIKKPKKTKEVK